MKQNHPIQQAFRNGIAILLTSCWAVSCDYIHDDSLQPCPSGLDLCFRYDYNLQRADMFNDHVRSVTAYIFDEDGNFLVQQTESGTPLADVNYRMHIDLEPGRYQFVVLAGQKSLADMQTGKRAKFALTEPKVGGKRTDISLTLDHDADGLIPHNGLPLDTLWHGMELTPVEIKLDLVTVDTISLVRNTKQINVALRDLDDPASVDVNDFDFRIYDRNVRLLWNNDVDETTALTYTPYYTWNTQDKPALPGAPEGIGRIAHVDFMTSRLLYHDRAEDDAILSIVNRKTGVEVVRVNLADMLSRLRTSADIFRYTPQEFLDRGYDYQLTFFLKGDSWEYVNIEISVLAWAKRIQYEHVII